MVKDWNTDSNASCLCRIVNNEPWWGKKTWKDWLIDMKLGRFYDKLVAKNLLEVPIIFRPFHEQTGSWFWWGQKSWDCKKHLGKENVISGSEAYKKLFQMTVDYLQNERGLENLIIAWSPDKLCKHDGHTCDDQRAKNDTFTDAEIKKDLLNSFPGVSMVDIVGIDLYYAEDDGSEQRKLKYQTEVFRKYLRVVTDVANQFGKVAALTETGNYNLGKELEVHQQAWNQCMQQKEGQAGAEQTCGQLGFDKARENGRWFTQHLLSLLNDPEVDMAYALTWENRTKEKKEYYIPFKDHPSFQDFVDFAKSDSILFKDDLEGVGEIKP